MEAKTKRKPGPPKGVSNNPAGKQHNGWGERKKVTLRLPTELLNQVSEQSENTTDFIIEAIAARLHKSR